MATISTSSYPKRHVVGRTCLCSPTSHPGSFRCSLHRNPHKPSRSTSTSRVRVSSGQWKTGMEDKANTIKALLLQLIKPSSHDLQRRRNFQPRPTRFCLMNSNNHNLSMKNNGVAVS
ncbi:hypothetical protein CsatA_003755 [Cannabis sativa]